MTLKVPAEGFLDSAAAVRSAADQNLDGLHGFVLGGVAGLVVSFGATAFLRGHVNEQRADGEEGFRW